MAKSPTGAQAAVIALAKERPEIGKVRASRLLRSRGVRLSPSGIHDIWSRHGLATSYQRLLAKSRRANGSKATLSEAQRALLERRRISRRVAARGDSAGHPRRDELVEVGARIFGSKGYDRASLREICAAAGILPGSMYHHFRSKEDLFVAVHAHGFRQINAALDRALEGKRDPWQRIEAAMAAHLTELLNGNDVAVVTSASLFSTAGPALQRRLNRERDAYEERFRAMIAALDLPANVDRSLLRLNLLGALNWARMWYRPGKKSPAQIAHHLVNSILRQRLG